MSLVSFKSVIMLLVSDLPHRFFVPPFLPSLDELIVLMLPPLYDPIVSVVVGLCALTFCFYFRDGFRV